MIALNVNSIISLGQNIAFLLCVPLLCHFLWLLLKTAPKYVKDIATALAFAFIAIIGMLSPLHVFEGLIVDGRIPLIMVATLYSTPTGFIAALLIAAYRFQLGGVGMPSAMMTISSAFIIAALARRFRLANVTQFQFQRFLLLGIIMVFVTGFWSYISPTPVPWQAFQLSIIPLLIWYPGCTLLLGNLFAQELTREKIEHDLQASTERYQSVVNDQLDPVIRWNADGTITFANEAYCRFRHKTQAEVIGRNAFDLFLEHNQQQHLAAIQHLSPEQPIHGQVYQHTASDSTLKWLEWTDRAFFDEKSKLREVQSVGRDVTALKQAENQLRDLNADLEQRVIDRTATLSRVNEALHRENREREEAEKALRASESQLRAILDSSPISMLGANSEDTLLYANPVAVSMFGFDRQALSTYRMPDLYQNAADGLELRRLMETQGYVKDVGIPIRTNDSSVRFGLVSVQPFQFAGQPAFLAAIVDITELRRAQESEHDQRTVAEALRDTAAALNSTLDFEEVLDRILANIDRVVKHEVSNIMLIEGDRVRTVRSRGYEAFDDYAKIATHNWLISDTSNLQWMMDHKQTLVIPNVMDFPGWIRVPELAWLRCHIGVPIIQDNEIIGFLNLDSATPGYFTEEHARRLQTFADQAATAIRNSHLYKQSKTIATLEERQRLARELHDSVTQTLFSASIIADALPILISANSLKVLPYLDDLRNLTRGALAEMRSLLIELRPEALERTQLGILLAQLCEVFTGQTQIEVQQTIDRDIILRPAMKIIFYRIAQEGLHNIAKHAHAQHVSLILHDVDDIVEMRIKDDGKGFDLNQIPPDHFGIKIMRERGEEGQAKLFINSQTGSGTEIILQEHRGQPTTD